MIKKYYNNLSLKQKITNVSILVIIIVLTVISFPTLARIQNRSTLENAALWDGTVATSYRSGNGTKDDPYIISNGNELAYFYYQEKITDYSDTYFQLANDIVLNNGLFSYNEALGIRYTIDNLTYYIDPKTNKYYLNKNFQEKEVGTITEFYSIDGFSGHFDGNSYRIYGLYLSDETNTVSELALFTDLRGSITNLYLENALINGGTISSPLVSNAEFANVENVLVSGNVISNNINTTYQKKYANITVDNSRNQSLDLPKNLPQYESIIVSAKLSGSYEVVVGSDESAAIMINDQRITSKEFEVEITDYSNLELAINTDKYTNIKFTDLRYEIIYDYSISGGIIASNNNTDITNAVSRVNLYNAKVSGGITGNIRGKVTISKSYNTGNINATKVAGGLVGVIENNDGEVRIYQSYNQEKINAPLVGGLISYINNSREIKINNSLNYQEAQNTINTINDTIVSINNVLIIEDTKPVETGKYDGEFTEVSKNKMYDASYLEENLLYQSFISLEDINNYPQNAWIFTNESLPILYLDDVQNPKATLYAKNNSWNNYTNEVNTVEYNEEITIKIVDNNEYLPTKAKQYYISSDAKVLTIEELKEQDNWTIYKDLIELNQKGQYIIYVKITDHNDNITYINSDIINYNVEHSPIDLILNNNTYNKLTEDLNNIYVNNNTKLTINNNDIPIKVTTVNYYISDKTLNKQTLDQMSNWIKYSDNINITNKGTYIVYLQVIDTEGNKYYANSDRIIYAGYNQTIYLGKEKQSTVTTNIAITQRSSITINFSYQSAINDIKNETRNLTTSELLPKNTKITMIDEITGITYQYVIPTDQDLYDFISSCSDDNQNCQRQAHYPLTLFQKIGIEGNQDNYQETDYYIDNQLSENFTFIFDFSNAKEERNYQNIEFKLEKIDKNTDKVINTLTSTVKTVDIYINKEAQPVLNVNGNNNSLVINNNNNVVLPISVYTTNQYVDNRQVYDTYTNYKYQGLEIKVVDTDNEVVDKNLLTNIQFIYEGTVYKFDKENIIRINFATLEALEKNLTLITTSESSNLKDENYSLVLTPYLAIDGYHYDELNAGSTYIPLTVQKAEKNNNLLTVEQELPNSTISKANDIMAIEYNINYAQQENRTLVVSLYKRRSLSAYDQSYELIDLINYVNEPLTSHSEDTYQVEDLKLSLELITKQFDNTGYKLVFDLYENNNKISTQERYFIVR